MSIPLSKRLFSQGVEAAFDNFEVVTTWDDWPGIRAWTGCQRTGRLA